MFIQSTGTVKGTNKKRQRRKGITTMPALSSFSKSQIIDIMVDRIKKEDEYIQKIVNALKIIVLDGRISAWLSENDPIALKQAKDALGIE